MTSNSEKTLAVIPARYASTRFPAKPLALIHGKPMIERVYKQACKAKQIDDVLVATDHPEIQDCVKNFGGNVAMTSTEHETGTDRIVEAIQTFSHEWILNLQGDEPLVNPEDLDQLIHTSKTTQVSSVATLVFPIQSSKDYNDPNVVKVVLNQQQNALYFSRASIPHQREAATCLWKHMGIYLFRSAFLKQFSQWPRSPLEIAEQLEQLRILERGIPIRCVEAQHEAIGVDTPEDLHTIEAMLKSNP